MNPEQTRILSITMGLVIVVVAFISLSDGGITGHVSIDANSQKLDLTLTQSQRYIISSDTQKPVQIKFIRVSGEVIGDGKAEIALDNGVGQRLIVYTNALEKPSANGITGMSNGITGMAVQTSNTQTPKTGMSLLTIMPDITLSYLNSESNEEIKYSDGRFSNECTETCIINMGLTNETTYALEFRMSEGTQLKIDNIVYGVLTE